MSPAPQDPLPAEVGEVLGSYKLGSVIGRGGMGCVYKAAHVRLGRQVAVKVLATGFAGDALYVSRFFHEAKVVNEIRHPNIIDIIDFIEQRQPLRVAYVMELLGGMSLSAALKRGPMSVVQAVNACFQLADVLDAVHQLGVVHRDLKPDNVFVVAPIDSDLGVIPSVKVLDFGVAKIADPMAAHRTSTGMIIGTPAYMAPEQIAAETVSAATDVYALGEIFYEMVSGKKLFATKDTGAVLKAKLLGQLPPLQLPPETPAPDQILELVRQCLDSEPRRRPALGQVKETLLSILGQAPRSETALGRATYARAPEPPQPARDPTPISLSQSAVLGGTSLSLPRPATGSKGILIAAASLAIAGLAILATVILLQGGEQEAVLVSPISAPILEQPQPDVAPAAPAPAPAPVAAPAIAPTEEEPKAEAPPPTSPAPVAQPKAEAKAVSPAPDRAALGTKDKRAKPSRSTIDRSVERQGTILRKDEVPEW